MALHIDRSSLFWRLILAMSAILLAGSLLLAFGARDYATTAADEAYDKLLLGAAIQIAEAIQSDNGVFSVQIPSSALMTLSNGGDERIFYNVINPDGQSITGYRELVAADRDLPPAGGTVAWNSTFRFFSIRALAYRQPIAGTSSSRLATVVVAQSTDARAVLVRDLVLRALLLLALISILALAGTIAAAFFGLRPLHRIENALLSRDPNDFTPLDENVPREIRELAQSINHFMGRLSERIDAMQRFIADAAHQIRTPVAALDAQVELLRHEDKAELKDARIARIAARTQQIGRLVNQLLAQAAVQHRSASHRAVRIDVHDVVRQAIRDASPLSTESHSHVALSLVGTDCFMTGDSVTLVEALRNIIENAIHHGHSKEVRVTVAQDAATVLVHVDDQGPGIPEAVRAEAVKPFVRLSRERDGSGLGLAIAADAARAHHGGLSFGTAPDGWFRVTLSLARQLGRLA